MIKLLKSLAGSTIVAALSFATTASAAPNVCEAVCSCTSPCYIKCTGGPTCGDVEVCAGMCPTGLQVSMNEEKAQDADASSQQVCTEQTPESSLESAES